MKASELIIDALQEIGAIGDREQLSPESGYKALRRLNSMLDKWRTERLTIFNLDRTLFTFVVNKGSYTIGPSSPTLTPDFVTPTTPVFLDRAAIVYDVGTEVEAEFPVQIFTRDQWGDQRLKRMTGTQPTGMYYERSEPLGTLYFHPVPTVDTIVPVLYLPSPLTSVASLNTPLILPPAYEEAIRYNLAVRCCRIFGRPVDQDIANLASDALADVKRSNLTILEMRVDPALLNRGGPWNILTGGF
jgi:hypothetical protein